jgi:hypothetical protein
MIRQAVHVLLALLVGVTLLLPASSQAQAASWHSGQGFGLWTISRICRNGVRITRVYFGTDNPDEWEDFVDIPQGFSANRAPGADAENEPYEIPIGDPIPNGLGLGTITVTMQLEDAPYHWVDDQFGTEGDAWVYGANEIRWPHLPVGRPVVVRRSGSQSAFIAKVTRCVFVSPQLSLPVVLR